MEGNHQQPLVTETIESRPNNFRVNGNSEPRDLAALNAPLARENAQLARERDLLRMVIDNLPDYIYAKDKDGRFILNNVAHAHDLGAKSPSEMKGKTDFDYFPSDLAQQFFDDEQRIIQTGAPVINQEQYKEKPGDSSSGMRWSVSSKVIWRDEQNKVLGTVGITRDIHEFKMAQVALRVSEQRLRES